MSDEERDLAIDETISEKADLTPEVSETDDAGEPSIRDALEAAWKEHGGDVPDRPEKPRDEKSGQFKKASGKPDKKSAATAVTQGAQPDKSQDISSTKQGQSAVGADTPPAGGPPTSWSKEAQSEWSKLPPYIQSAVTKREEEMTAGAKKIQERYGFVHELTNQIGPYLQKYGRTPAQGIGQLGAWFIAMERDPVVAIRALAKSYNLDLGKLTGAATQPAQGDQPNPPTSPTQSDPRLDAALREINNLKAADANRQAVATHMELQKWGSSKSHFEKVRQAMAQVVAGCAQTNDTSIFDQNGRLDLDKIYDRAIYMVPEVRDAVLKEKATAEANARREQADKARRAASSARPGSPGSASRMNGRAPARKPGVSEVRQAILDAVDEHRS